MNIIKKDFKNGKVTVRITDPDDFWYLSQLIEPTDLIKGKTTRKVKIGDSEKVAKKTYHLTIEAETIELTESSVRVNGKIKDGPEDLPRDSYQAITGEIESELTITKPQWLSYQKQKLQESSEKKYNYLILLLEREEALFAVTQKFGFKILAKVKGDVPKKGKKTEILKDFHAELLKALETYDARLTPESVVIASPAFYKEDFAKKIRDEPLRKKIILATSSGVSEASLDEVIKRPELSSALKSSRMREEQVVVDELLLAIKKDLASYGIKDVTKSVEAGAVSSLVLTDEFIKKQREKKTFEKIDELMKHVDNLQGKIHVISSDHDGGKKVNGLGGIAALLRYKLQ